MRGRCGRELRPARLNSGAHPYRRALLVALVLTTGLAACGGGAGSARSGTTNGGVELSHATLRVPGGYRTVQAAVAHAEPGDMILVAPGVYHGGTTVDVPDLVIRGTDRDTVIFDGDNSAANGFTVEADGVSVENLTVRNYAINGILFTKAAYTGAGSQASSSTPVLEGYRVSYVTSYDNGLYGIYAFVARDGEIDHVDATGQPDSGIYIGQCRPCDAVVTDSTAEGDRVGFEAANASGGLYVIDSDFSSDRDGVAVESSLQEQLAPQSSAVVAGDLVTDNDNRRTPTEDEDTDVFGYGIAIGGGSDDTVLDNRVTGNVSVGIILTDLAGYSPHDDTVRGNVTSGNGVDLAYEPTVGGTTSSAGNCFAANRSSDSTPPRIEALLACGAPSKTVPSGMLHPRQGPAGVDYSNLPAPPPEAGLPDAATAPADPATGLPPAVDLARIEVPAP